jgi:hypothetical protein
MNTYAPDTHEYYQGGILVPSVTQVLPSAKFWITPEQLETAREEGTDNHAKICMFYDAGRDTFGDPYLKDFMFFLEEHPEFGSLLKWETPLYSAKHKFAGRPDIIYDNAIIDIKLTPGDLRRVALQLAGYSILARENKILTSKKWFMIWHDGKKFKLKNVYNDQAEAIFLSLVKRYWIDQATETYFKTA